MRASSRRTPTILWNSWRSWPTRANSRFDFAPIPLELPYHAPCQLKAHGMGRPALDVLNLIPGLRLWEIDADCCGIAGTYGYKKEKREISEAVGRSMAEQITRVGQRSRRVRYGDVPLADHGADRGKRVFIRWNCSRRRMGSAWRGTRVRLS